MQKKPNVFLSTLERFFNIKKVKVIIGLVFILFGAFLYKLCYNASAKALPYEVQRYRLYMSMCVAEILVGVLFIVLAIFQLLHEKKEFKRAESRKNNISPLRTAELSVPGKIFLKASECGYSIVYRRVKNVNELIIDGKVYDEMKAFLEFSHKLTAEIDGHFVEVGLDKRNCVYICFDGEIIAEKRRIM